ncbi:MAG: glycosyltransferase family protein [Crocosphaera sp.]|nr:glycosyltransferase family protein [Crocosphaera sp.]MDJ0686554.1 glycosyltransferase family protein [Alphaproteobacteria bacterium]
MTPKSRQSTLAIVQARMGSSRLPGKVMASVGGRPLIDWHIDRLAMATSVDQLVVATSTNPADDPLAEHLAARGVAVFRGSEENVLDRFAECAAHYKTEIVTRTTADCPLIDPMLYDALVETFLQRRSDQHIGAISLTHAPRGFDVEIFTNQALQQAGREASDPYDREHVTPFLYRQADRIHPILYLPPIDAAQFRLCVDEQRDLDLIAALYQAMGSDLFRATAQEIVATLEARPDIAEINRYVLQKTHADSSAK